MKWHKGPPPEIGWWPASIAQDPGCIRWWNGYRWSLPAFVRDSANTAAKMAAKRSDIQAFIQWTDRWWL